jgi:hypothetical protein
MALINRIYQKFFLKVFFHFLLVSLTLCLFDTHALIAAEDPYWQSLNVEKEINYPDGWFYTLDEIKKQYIIEYKAGKRLSNCITKKAGNFISSCNSDNIIIPETFINQTLHFIQALLDRGLVRYIFRLDTFHGHLFVPEEIFLNNYNNKNTFEMIRLYTHEKDLGILFHNAEHLALHNPQASDTVDAEALELAKKRNVIGWYDGRPLEIILYSEKTLLHDRKSATASIPAGYRNVGVITFKAVKNGEFSIIHNGETIRIDISPYECYYH